MDFKLNEYQIKRIKDRSKLNFYEELEKNNKKKEIFVKNFKNHLDIFVNEMYNNGVLFYGFTIKIPFLEKSDSNLWNYIHLQTEKWVNDFRDKIELIEFCYISINLESDKILEKSSNFDINIYKNETLLDIPYYNVIIGVRSLIGKNDFHFNEMKKLFNLSYYDIIIEELSSVKEIKEYWNFVIRQNNFKFHRFCQFSSFYEELYGGIAELESQYDDDHYAFDLDQEFNSKNSNIEGIKNLNPSYITIISYLITLYFNKYNYYLNNNYIYKKVDGYKFSYEILDYIDYLNKFNIKLMNDLKMLFPQQLQNLKVSELLNLSWSGFYLNIMSNNHYIRWIEFMFDAIEFKDGIYFLSKNKFFSFEKKSSELENIFLNKKCVCFSNVKFKNLKKPIKWLNSIFPLSDDFCILFASKLNAQLIKNNKNDLFINNLFLFKKKIILSKLKENYSLAEILIYCNRLYFKSKNIKKNGKTKI